MKSCSCMSPGHDDGHCRKKGAIARCHIRHIIVWLTVLLGVAVSLWCTVLSLDHKMESPSSSGSSNTFVASRRRRLFEDEHIEAPSPPLRILYIITSLAEYNTGTRATQKGSDRLQETLLPILTEGVESMLALGYQVDVYLITHWTVRPERLELIRASLESLHSSSSSSSAAAEVGLEIWEDAMPMGYPMDDKKNNGRIKELPTHLARQHRFVIRDKLMDYDFFIAMEDDMLIHGTHVQHFLDVSNRLLHLREHAPETVTVPKGVNPANVFYGPLTKSQLRRLVPGLMRVEVLLDEERFGTQDTLAAIPVNLDFDGVNRTVNPKPCCHVANKTVNSHIPASPPSDKIFMWETGVEGLSVREIQDFGFVAFLGATSGFKASPVIGDYWSGREGEFGKMNRPRGHTSKYVSNQGGWMATRWQVMEWHADICLGGYLPPFDAPHFRFDGLDMRNVEYWSGGLHLFTYRHACNLQRVVSLDPEGFSKHLIYHSANNKQAQLNSLKKDRFVKIDNLLGQLNTVKKRAEAAKRNESET